MNHSCRIQAGVPSVTVRPDMFGFVHGVRTPPSENLGETLMTHLRCPVEQRLQNEAAMFFFFFFFGVVFSFIPQQDSVKATSHFLFFSFTGR